MLLLHGANPNLSDDKKVNPFIHVFFSKNEEIQKILLKHELKKKGVLNNENNQDHSQDITEEQLVKQFWIEIEKTGYAQMHGLTLEFILLYKNQPAEQKNDDSLVERTQSI